MLNIDIDINSQYNCLDNIFACVAKYYGKEHKLIFSYDWDFSYEPEKSSNMGECIQFKYDNQYKGNFLREFYNIGATKHTENDFDVLIETIREALKKGNPLAIWVDTFFCPWCEESYQKYHKERYMLAIGLDNEENLKCIDTEEGNQLRSISIYKLRNTLKDYMIFRKLEDFNYEINWEELIRERLESILGRNSKESIFNKMRHFAKDIPQNLDINREIEGFENRPYEASIYRKLYRSGMLRKQFASLLKDISNKHSVTKLFEFARSLERIANKWNVAFGVLSKAYLVDDNSGVLERMEKKILDIANTEEKLAESLLDFINELNLKEHSLQNTFLTENEIVEEQLDCHFEMQGYEKNILEKKIERIWQNVLETEKNIGINTNFFELGGDSLKISQVIFSIYNELNIKIPIKNMFSMLTIREIEDYILETYINKHKKQEGDIDDDLELPVKLYEKREYYPLTYSQRAIFLNHQAHKSLEYNMVTARLLKGRLDYGKLEHVLAKLINRHEVFRTNFQILDNEPVQIVQDEVDFDLEYREVKKEDIPQAINDFIRPFDLSKAPLFRGGLFKISEKEHLFVYDMHHIISDGSSLSIIKNEIAKLYNQEELIEVKRQYKDYAIWQNEQESISLADRINEYWENVFSDGIPALELPKDFLQIDGQSYESNTIKFEISQSITEALKGLSNRYGVTLHTVVLMVYTILLNKYTNQNDMVIGSISAGRTQPEIENTLGTFINLVPLRIQFELDNKFYELMEVVQNTVLDSYENQNYEFSNIVQSSNKGRYSTGALCETIFNFHNEFLYDENLNMEGLDIRVYDIDKKNESGMDIQVDVFVDENQTIQGELEYNATIFKEETIKDMITDFIDIAEYITKNPEKNIGEIDLLSEAEKNQLLFEFNKTKKEYTKDKTIHQLFEEQIEKTPNNVALVKDGRKLTYRELNEKSNILARLLRDKGVKPNSIVGVICHRSFNMVLGIMAVMKAGGGYLPIDSNYPKERIEYMLQDSEVDIVLTESSDKNVIDFNGEKIYIDQEYPYDSSNLENVNSPNDLVYVIYTSGSTGRPKGVMIQHKNLANLAFGLKDVYKLDHMEVNLLQLASFSFDVFSGDVVRALLNGGKLVIGSKYIIADHNEMYKLIKENKITIFESTPSIIIPFMEFIHSNGLSIDSLKILIMGSDTCKVDKFRNIVDNFGEDIRVINSYGITEATIDSCYYECLGNDEELNRCLPIGIPLPNVTCYIMNPQRKLQSIGVVGELYIGGVGVGLGYLNRPELNSDKFIENPYIEGEKLYKTGDLARYLPTGNLEFLGRIDNQVKIRGLRIELEEIENMILTYDGIDNTVVVAREYNSGEKYICAYIISEHDIETQDLRKYLLDKLPNYMIPSHFLKMDKFPITANGKIDRNKLPAPKDKVNSRLEYKPPRNDTDEKLITILSSIIYIDKIGLNQNFFEIGGNSLKAIILISKLHKEMKVDIPLDVIFKASSIEEISDYIIDSEEDAYLSIETVEERQFYPMASVQKNIFALSNLDKSSTSYNIPTILEIEENLDEKRLIDSFHKLISRHEILRTSFKVIKGEYVQKVHKEIDFHVDVIETSLSEVDGIVEEIIRPFDLGEAPLIKAKILKVSEDKYILIMDVHHIVVDGKSTEILVSELWQIYSQKELPKLPVQYKDYAVWHNNMLLQDKGINMEEYWINKFNDEIPVLDIPTDYPRKDDISFEGESIKYEISEELMDSLNRICREANVTMNTILLASYFGLIANYACQEDIIIGLPVIGRRHMDLENVVGMFVNTLPVRAFPKGDKTFRQFLFDLQDSLLSDYSNQEYPLEKLLDKLELKKIENRNLLFDILFSYMGFDGEGTDMSDREIDYRYRPTKNQTVKFDLGLYAFSELGEISLDLQYRTCLFKKETMEEFMEHFIKVLYRISDDIDTRINEFELYDIEENDEVEIEDITFSF